MYNRNLLAPVRFARVDGFDYPSTGLGQAQANPLGIANVCAKPKNSNLKPVTDGYTRPLCVIILPSNEY